ncbi:solute carrier family 23 member 1-like [Saccoglossus kowalevskii]
MRDRRLLDRKEANGRSGESKSESEILRDRQISSKEEAQQILQNMKGDMTYGIADSPPWFLSILLGFQHYLSMFGAILATSIMLADALCMSKTDEARADLIATMFFVSGLVTILQVLFGVRLPVVHGSSLAFLVAIVAILALPKWSCPAPEIVANMTGEEREELWQVRMREIQGNIAASSGLLVVIGLTGLVGIVLRFIGPLAITPTIVLIGLSLFDQAGELAGSHWGISVFTMVIITIFSEYLKNVSVPCYVWNRSSGCRVKKYPLFTILPVILAIALAWLLCYILTVTDALPDSIESYGYPARTDIRMNVFYNSKWFYIPYPCQWGVPTVSITGFIGMLPAVLVAMVDSVGNYYAAARISMAPPPPTHAINRGIFVQGIGGMISGIWGCGNGVSVYSENIGVISITKVGSRMVVIIAGLIMMLLAMLGKFGALFAAIPDPVIGGMFCILFGIVTAVGLTNLQFVDMNSSRNLFIIGVSIFIGLTMPNWIKNNKGTINTGVDQLDQIIMVLLSTGMFVGGIIAFVFDNTIPGTEEERGISKWRNIFTEKDKELNMAVSTEVMKCYEFPFGNDLIHKWRHITQYIPMCPTFVDITCSCNCSKCKHKNGLCGDEDTAILITPKQYS